MYKGRRIVLLVGGPALPSSTVLGLMKEGYAVEWVSEGKIALERIDRQLVQYDAMVITPAIRDMTQQGVAIHARNMMGVGNLSIICLGRGNERVNGSVYTLVPDTIHDLKNALVMAFTAGA